MSRTIPKLLIVEDEKNTREGIGRALKFDYQVTLAENAESGLNILNHEKFDLILTDVKMPGMDGVTFVREALHLNPNMACVVMTAYGAVETAVDAMKSGAYDFLIKPVKLNHVETVLKNAFDSLQRKQQVQKVKTSSNTSIIKTSSKSNIIAHSREMHDVLNLVRQIAPTRSTVLITGESGTGKEVIANALHSMSDRASGPFIAVHCAALNANLLESELFGHEKGAFTNANARKTGRFEAADGGTIFLDEIGEIDASTQIKLLRVLESRTFERVGGTETLSVDVRVVAATNRDLKQMVEAGEFREDLYYRLDVLNVNLPPLRERKDDIPLLLNHFLQIQANENKKDLTGFSPQALEALSNYSWRGNVRELRNVVERMSILCKGKTIELSDIPDKITNEPKVNGAPTKHDASLDIATNETQLILRALKESNNNKTAAAKMLGMSRRTLHRRITELGLQEENS
jgi:two-component system, NtrC family, response regulator AtoC